MITAYASIDNQIVAIEMADIPANLEHILWIDLNSPTQEEEHSIENWLGIDIPTREEMAALELSNRLYQEDEAAYLAITLVTHADSEEPENKPYIFVLAQNTLVTVRYADTQPFRAYTSRLIKTKIPGSLRPALILIGLLEAIVNRLADILEGNGTKIDQISKHIFRQKVLRSSEGNASKEASLNLYAAIQRNGIEGDMISKVKESLVSLSRLVGYSRQVALLTEAGDKERMKTLALDITALNEHASFLSAKTEFLLDATLGMIAMQQNSIAKILSVAAVIFLPPTLVAGLYGMNFIHMPELSWKWGYPMAIGFMLASAYLPYRFFKYRGWL